MTLAPAPPPTRDRAAGRGRWSAAGRLSAADRRALVLWIASRAAVAVLAVAGAWNVSDHAAAGMPSFVSLWDHWDVGLFTKIAHWGYDGFPAHYPDRGVVAFFPGLPMVLRALHPVLGGWVGPGLLVSLVSGAIASVALVRLGALEDDAATGSRAALYLVLSPYAVFLFAGYSEALFLALAIPAWLSARRGRWWAAGLLAAGAASVRVTGLFLAVALVVHYAVTVRRPRPDACWLLAPFAVVAGYAGYLYALTGDWLAWPHAQRVWGRQLTLPWTAFVNTWHGAFDSGRTDNYAWSFRAEILAVLVGLALTVVLLWLRRWGEATYVGLQVIAFATSSFYLSVGRATLLWWPLWLLLARWSMRRPAVHVAYLSVAPALMAVAVLSFTNGHWVG